MAIQAATGGEKPGAPKAKKASAPGIKNFNAGSFRKADAASMTKPTTKPTTKASAPGIKNFNAGSFRKADAASMTKPTTKPASTQKGPTSLQKPSLQTKPTKPTTKPGGSVQSPGPGNLPGAKAPAAGKPTFNMGSFRKADAASMQKPTTKPKATAPKKSAPSVKNFNAGSFRKADAASMAPKTPTAPTAKNVSPNQFGKNMSPKNRGMQAGM